MAHKFTGFHAFIWQNTFTIDTLRFLKSTESTSTSSLLPKFFNIFRSSPWLYYIQISVHRSLNFPEKRIPVWIYGMKRRSAEIYCMICILTTTLSSMHSYNQSNPFDLNIAWLLWRDLLYSSPNYQTLTTEFHCFRGILHILPGGLRTYSVLFENSFNQLSSLKMAFTLTYDVHRWN